MSLAFADRPTLHTRLLCANERGLTKLQAPVAESADADASTPRGESAERGIDMSTVRPTYNYTTKNSPTLVPVVSQWVGDRKVSNGAVSCTRNNGRNYK